MSGTIIREWNFWTASIITGACMAFVYDLLRLFRRLVRHGRIAVDLEDILYWTACFLASFSLLYYGNNGVIRFAAVFGAAAGMALYAVTIGRVFVKYSFLIIDKTIGNLIRFIVKIIGKMQRKMVALGHKINIFYKNRLTKMLFHHKIKTRRDDVNGRHHNERSRKQTLEIEKKQLREKGKYQAAERKKEAEYGKRGAGSKRKKEKKAEKASVSARKE